MITAATVTSGVQLVTAILVAIAAWASVVSGIGQRRTAEKVAEVHTLVNSASQRSEERALLDTAEIKRLNAMLASVNERLINATQPAAQPEKH